MCKFHKDVSRMVATDPLSGTVNQAHEAVIRVALSRYWVERYVAGGEVIDGYSAYPMATVAQQEAFAVSGLAKPLDVVVQETREGADFLRARLAAWEQAEGPLSVQGLGLPMATARDAFIDKAILSFYQGDPKGDFRFVAQADEHALQPLHRAVAFLQEDLASLAMLERMVTGRIATLYTQAPGQVKQSVMRAYERLPERAKNFLHQLGAAGGNIMMGGFSGLAGHGVHYGAIMGTSAMSGMASYANFALSGVFLAASYGVWDRVFGGRYRTFPEKRNALLVQTALTVSMAFGGYALMGHDHGQHGESHGGHDRHHGHRTYKSGPSPREAAAVQERVQKLMQAASKDDLARWKANADEYGWTLQEFLENVCITLPQLPAENKQSLKPQPQ